jgi:pyruvate/2-oxoglutarate dehydrogenase complex dihydrolipoamide acyltransferase (E2) component
MSIVASQNGICHLSRQLVTEGDTVQAGDVIGWAATRDDPQVLICILETRINDMPWIRHFL